MSAMNYSITGQMAKLSQLHPNWSKTLGGKNQTRKAAQMAKIAGALGRLHTEHKACHNRAMSHQLRHLGA